MTLIASDGYEYEDLTQRLLGNPLDNRRNSNIRNFRALGRAEAAVRAYIEGFGAVCPEGDPGPSEEFGKAHQQGLRAAFDLGGFRVTRPDRASLKAFSPTSAAAVHPAH